MADLSVNYMGLQLKNPIIVGSCGLMNSILEIQQVAAAGAGAVVLKSIFEEQIRHEMDVHIDNADGQSNSFIKGYENVLAERPYDYMQAYDYLADHFKEQTLSKYISFVAAAKKSVDIPVIASINCTSAYDWHYFARRIEAAGADAIELNIYVLPSNTEKSAQENEKVYFDIVETVLKQVKIPVAVKMSYYFSSLAHTITQLSNTGIGALVLFNRPFHPDIDINTLEVVPKYIYSEDSEYSHILRWIAILSQRVGCNLVASTGVHSAETVIKQLLAGATAVQVVSAVYKNGFKKITEIINGLSDWMDNKDYKSIADFRGKVNQYNVKNPAEFERVQFMRLYSKIV